MGESSSTVTCRYRRRRIIPIFILITCFSIIDAAFTSSCSSRNRFRVARRDGAHGLTYLCPSIPSRQDLPLTSLSLFGLRNRWGRREGNKDQDDNNNDRRQRKRTNEPQPLDKRQLPGVWNQRLWKIRLFFQRKFFQRYTVYVLQCEHDKWYVGSTINRRKRYQSHFNEDGSSWTKLHPPLKVYEEHKRVPEKYYLGLESQITAQYMFKYGVNNVRGAMYTRTKNYTLKELQSLVGFIGHYNELKYRDLHNTLREELTTWPTSSSSSSRESTSTSAASEDDDDEEEEEDGEEEDQQTNETKPYSTNTNTDIRGNGAIRGVRRLTRGSMPQQGPSFTTSNANTMTSGSSSTTSGVDWSSGTFSSSSPAGSNGNSYDSNLRCFNCGLLGHRKIDCPWSQDSVCHNCGEAGHWKVDCPNPPKCFFCGQSGHTKSDCPKFLATL